MFRDFLFITKAQSPQRRGTLRHGKKRKNMPGYTIGINTIGRRYWRPITTVKAVYKDKQDYIRNKARLGDIVRKQGRNVVVLGRLKDKLVTLNPVKSEVSIDDFQKEQDIVLRGVSPNLLWERPNLLKQKVIGDSFTVEDVLRHPDNWARMQELKQANEIRLPAGFELGDSPSPRFQPRTPENRESRIQLRPEEQFALENGFLPFGSMMSRKKTVSPKVDGTKTSNEPIDISTWQTLGSNEQRGIQASRWVKDPSGQLYLDKDNEPIQIPEFVVTPSAIGERMASLIGQSVGIPVNEVLIGKNNGKHTSLHRALEGTSEGEAKSLASLSKERVQEHLTSPEVANIAVFDTFLLNGDRHLGNLMEDKDGKLFAIDNSYCYTSSFIARQWGSFSKEILDSIVNDKSISVFRLFEGDRRKFTVEQKKTALDAWRKHAELTDRQLEDWVASLPDEVFNVVVKQPQLNLHYDRVKILEHYKQRRDEFKSLYDSMVR